MKKILFVLCLGLGLVGSSQLSICDSIFIDSCEMNPNNNTEIQLLASNHSVDIISYPGFILFNNNGDTIAKENVSFFGIGWGFQPHILQIINPPILPLYGYLELHSNFYDSLRCVFQGITILDTTLFIINEVNKQEVLVSPNPTNDLITLEIETYNGPFEVEIYDLQGRLIETTKSRSISLKKYSKGIYIFRVSYGDIIEELRVVRD